MTIKRYVTNVVRFLTTLVNTKTAIKPINQGGECQLKGISLTLIDSYSMSVITKTTSRLKKTLSRSETTSVHKTNSMSAINQKIFQTRRV